MGCMYLCIPLRLPGMDRASLWDKSEINKASRKRLILAYYLASR